MPDPFERDVYCLLGLPFDAVDLDGAVRRVRDAARHRQSCFFSTPNLNFVVASLADEDFRRSVVYSDLSFADGMPLVWIARLFGIPIRERTAGSNLFDSLRDSPGKQLSVFFFGGPDGVAEAACRRLSLEDKGLTCVGYESPGFGSIEEMSSEAVIRRINDSQADFLVVSLGARKGQAWIELNRPRLTVPVISHLGAVLNFVAGTAKRAPAWMQRTGLEWIWRIKEEPALWRRYLADGIEFFALLATRVLPYAWYLMRHAPAADQLAAAALEARDEEQIYVIRLRGAWTRANIAPLRDCFAKAVLGEKDVTLDMAGVTYVDSAFVGLAILLQGYQSRRGRRLLVVSLQDPVRRVIGYCCADYLC